MTIFALSSAAGRAGVAVLRVSGPLAGDSLRQLTRDGLPKARVAVLRTLYDPSDASPIDRGLVIWFPGPNSFTGEDSAEFHVHGGRAVVDQVLRCLAGIQGLRPADPGEFTRRAFDRGKLDLAEVEGLADLISAETEAQRRLAFGHFSGEFSKLIESWRDRLVRALAHLEATIDFPDEDLPDGVVEGLSCDVRTLGDEISAFLDDRRRGELVRDGCHVVILGEPNVGKSSLLNSLARRDAAIVSTAAGTTRDVIEVNLDLDGYSIFLADTAGIRDLGGPSSDGPEGFVEAEGIRRSKARAETADIKLVVLDATVPVAQVGIPGGLLNGECIVVLNKSDALAGALPPDEVEGRETIVVSALTGEGLDRLLAVLSAKVRSRFESQAEAPALTRQRHRLRFERLCRVARAVSRGRRVSTGSGGSPLSCAGSGPRHRAG